MVKIKGVTGLCWKMMLDYYGNDNYLRKLNFHIWDGEKKLDNPLRQNMKIINNEENVMFPLHKNMARLWQKFKHFMKGTPWRRVIFPLSSPSSFYQQLRFWEIKTEGNSMSALGSTSFLFRPPPTFPIWCVYYNMYPQLMSSINTFK